MGERAGSGLSGIFKRWENVYHTPVTIEETHKDGVDRTVLTLSTGGHEQDVQAMLELYGDLIDPTDPQSDQKTTQKTSASDLITSRSNQKSDQEIESDPQSEINEPQNGVQEVHDPQSKSQKLLEAVQMNPKITKSALSEMLGISSSTLKRWLKVNNIVWVGHSKNGYWEIIQSK